MLNKRLIGTVAALAALVSLSITGVSTAATAKQNAAVKSAIKEFKKYQTPVRKLDIPALKKAAPRGKTLTIINCLTCGLIADGAKAAASKLDWKVTVLNPQFTPESTAGAWTTAVQSNPDVIIAFVPFPLTSVSKQLADAKAKGIVVVTVGGEPTPAGGKNPLTADAGGGGVYSFVAKLYADVAIADAKKGPSAAIVVDPAVPAWKAITSGFKKQVQATGGKFHQIDVGLSDIGKGGPGKIVSYLQKNPDVKYVATTIPAFYLGVRQALQAAGLDKKVKVIVGATQAPNMEQAKSGEILGTVALEVVSNGWRLVDAAARKLTGSSMSCCTHIKSAYLIVTPKKNANLGKSIETYPGRAADFIKAWKGPKR